MTAAAKFRVDVFTASTVNQAIVRWNGDIGCDIPHHHVDVGFSKMGQESSAFLILDAGQIQRGSGLLAQIAPQPERDGVALDHLAKDK